MMGEHADRINDDSPDPMLEPVDLRLPRKPGRVVPKQKPGKSKQDYGTPKVFLDAVKKKFNVKAFAYDLAADATNKKAAGYFTEAQDSLVQDWTKLLWGDLWLNPPFGRIEPWAKKCAASAWWESETSKRGPADGRRIFLLVPAAVGSNWFQHHVFDRSRVMLLNGRIPFDGCPVNPNTGKVDGYIKDCILAVYGEKPGVEAWRWDK
jgi:phage N-6-adenine-methyltransferase